MAARNFWLDAYIDGRTNPLSGGPQSKDGGFELNVKMRDEGQTPTVVKINGYAHNDGKLKLEVLVLDADGKVVSAEEVWTER